MTWEVRKTLLWVHYVNLGLARSKFEPPGTAWWFRSSGIQAIWQFARQISLLMGMPDDQARLSGQAFSEHN